MKIPNHRSNQLQFDRCKKVILAVSRGDGIMTDSKRRYIIATVGSLCILLLSACTSNNVSADNTENKNISENGKNISETIVENVTSNDKQECDLLYRQYKIGSHMGTGNVIISKETIEEVANNPEAIIIFYNDRILKTMPYEGEELLFHLEKAGWYCFAILEGNQMVDISGKVSSFENIENSHIIPLN